MAEGGTRDLDARALILALFPMATSVDDREIGDPYGCPLKIYEACRDEMVEAIPSLLAFLKTLVPEK